MIFQGDSIFPWMTVWNNAAYGLKMRGVPSATIKEVVGHYLARTGLTRFADYYPHQLSGGMRQRVSIARAFANDPEILLMDEPFSALDAQNKLLLQEELLRIWEEHKKTVVFITHSVDEAVLLGDRIMVMTAQPGQVKAMVKVPLRAAAQRAGAAEGAGVRRPRPFDLVEPARRGAARAGAGGCKGAQAMSVQTISTTVEAAPRISARTARPPAERDLAGCAVGAMGGLRALRLHRHAVLSGAVQHPGDHG